MPSQNKLIDIIKFLGCICVVAVHQCPFGIYGTDIAWAFNCTCRWAVPFFFAISSYLFYKRGGQISKYLRRLFLLYISWIVLWGIIWIISGKPTQTICSLKEFLNHLFFGNIIPFGWFIIASIEATFLVWFLGKKISNTYLLIIGICLFSLSLSFGLYYNLYNTQIKGLLDGIGHIAKPTNSFIVAFIYIVIGKIVAERETVYSQKNKVRYLLLILTSIIIGGLECLILKDVNRWIPDAMIALPLFTYSFLSIIVYSKLTIPISYEVCKYLRNCSIIIYLSHHLFIIVLKTFHLSNDIKSFCFVFICSLTFATVLQLVSKRIKILKYLY